MCNNAILLPKSAGPYLLINDDTIAKKYKYKFKILEANPLTVSSDNIHKIKGCKENKSSYSNDFFPKTPDEYISQFLEAI